MRRNTLTPARGRVSMAHTDDVTERRNVRSIKYQEMCINNALSFLEEHNYENTSVRLLKSPTIKEFQNMFKFLVSFFYKSWEVKKFEDDAMQLVKLFKYPYASEINKSHLVTTSPHSWPVVLSFVSWLVDMIRFIDTNEEEETDMFMECCYDGYLRFMEGIDNHFEEKLDETIKKQQAARIKEYENKLEKKKELEEKMKEFKHEEENAVLNKKIEELEEDKKNILNGFKQLQNKREKYLKEIEMYKNESLELNESINELKEQRNKLKENIDKQKINVESFKEMNQKKNELLKQLEKIKIEKERLFITLNEKEKELGVLREETEKYAYDFKSVSGLDIHKNTTEQLEEDICKLNDKIIVLEDKKTALEEEKNELTSQLNTLEENIKYYSSRLLSLGKLYLEKKEVSDIEERKGRKEMERLDNELMNLAIESNNSVLLSEQMLQRAKIRMDRMVVEINNEQNEINKEMYKFYNEIVGNLGMAADITKEINKLTDS